MYTYIRHYMSPYPQTSVASGGGSGSPLCDAATEGAGLDDFSRGKSIYSIGWWKPPYGGFLQPWLYKSWFKFGWVGVPPKETPENRVSPMKKAYNPTSTKHLRVMEWYPTEGSIAFCNHQFDTRKSKYQHQPRHNMVSSAFSCFIEYGICEWQLDFG
jgi:hypothetical protein